MRSSSVLDSYIRERHLEGPNAEFFLGLSVNFKSEMDDLITELSPSANALRNILLLIEEIAKRESLSLSEVYSSSALFQVLQDKDIPRKEKTKRVREILERRRYPERTRLENLVQENVSGISRKFNIKVTLPDELEGDRLEIKMYGRSPEDFQDAAQKLAMLSESRELNTLFGILRGEV